MSSSTFSNEPTSMEEYAAQWESFDQKLLALRREMIDKTFVGSDESRSIKAKVDPSGRVLDIKIHSARIRELGTDRLAESIPMPLT